MQPVKELQSVHPMIVEAVTLFNRMEEIQQEIANRAYALFENRGREHGRAFEDWTTAEAELLTPVALTMSETKKAYKITAEIPGFDEKAIQIAVEPNCVFLSGKIENAIEEDMPGTELIGRQTKMFFQALDLPAAIDITKAEARLNAGILTLTLPKYLAGETVETKAAKEIPVE